MEECAVADTVIAEEPPAEDRPRLSLKRDEELKEEGTGPNVGLPPAAVVKKPSSFTVFAILGLVAVVLCAVLLFLQWREMSFYVQPPSAFPVSPR